MIIAVFQGEDYVLGALHSALNQTHPDVEILVVDDGSTDGTWALLSSMKDHPRVRLIRQTNQGVSAARNRALAEAKGEFIAFLDADDLWLPTKLEAELATLRKAGSPVGIAYSWYYAVDEDARFLNRSPKCSYTGLVFEDLLKGTSFILPSASLFHRRIFDTLGGYDTKRRHHEDFAFTLRASRTFPAFPTAQYLVLYRQSVRGKGRSVMNDYDRAVSAALSLADDLRDLLSESEVARLRDSQRRSLYFRFLMYGFNASAARMLVDFPGASVGGGSKGVFGALFAKTRLNGMLPARIAVQSLNRVLSARGWHRTLASCGVTSRSGARVGGKGVPSVS